MPRNNIKYMMKFFKFTIIFLLLFNAFSFCALAVTETATPETGLLPDKESGAGGCPNGGNCGNYSLNDMVSVALKVSNFILGIVGSLALLAFVAGGVMWTISAGNQEMVTRGKQTILGAIIGLAIVFASYMIIQLVYGALGISAADAGKWAVSNWFNK